jgi:hypothetical protein
MPTATEVREPEIENRPCFGNRSEFLSDKQFRKSRACPAQRPLFVDSLLDSGRQERNRRRFAAVFSFTFQSLLIGVLLIVPLMFTEALPKQQLLTFLLAPPPPPPPSPAVEAVAKVVRQIRSNLLTSGQLRTPGPDT